MFTIYIFFISISLRTNATHISKRIAFYRCVFLLNELHNDCYTPTLLPVRFLFYGQYTIAAFAVLMRLRDAISLQEGCVLVQFVFSFTLSAFLYLHICGRVGHDSKMVAQDLCRDAWMMGKPEGKIWRKVTKSLKPFGVKINPIRRIGYRGMNDYFENLASMLTTVLVALPM